MMGTGYPTKPGVYWYYRDEEDDPYFPKTDDHIKDLVVVAETKTKNGIILLADSETWYTYLPPEILSGSWKKANWFWSLWGHTLDTFRSIQYWIMYH